MLIKLDRNDLREMVKRAFEKVLEENVYIDSDKVNRKKRLSV